MTKSLFDTPSRFLSRDECDALAKRVFGMTQEGETTIRINSSWGANIRWARNQVTAGGDRQFTSVTISRSIRGASGSSQTNSLEDADLKACLARAEHQITLGTQNPETYPKAYPDTPEAIHPHGNPEIWFDRTFNLDATARGIVARDAIVPAEAADLLSAGFVSVAGRGYAVVDTEGVFRYYPFTTSQFSTSVRNPKGTGSGWAGVDQNDWGKIDTQKLSQIAMDKCVQSADPVGVEPGRYVAILEPQAVCDLFAPLMDRAMSRIAAEMGRGPFAEPGGETKIGQQLLDRRITVSADPMDPECGFVPFDWSGEPYRAVNWFEDGILKELYYPRHYARTTLGLDTALSNSRAFRMSGGTSSIEEMIASTDRGVLVTRFNNLNVIHEPSWLTTGNTRDGLWLIERGKISRPIKNFRINESPLFALNNVEQLGIPQRVFRPGAPAICPPVKVRDFAFTGLMDAV